MKCILCESTSQFLDDYKLNIESDIDYFGKLKIFYCESCDLGFANPMPDSEKLNYFYSNIYRAKGRPHEIPENYRFNLYSERNLSYFTYLSTFVNFENINNIFDYGSGLGDLGSLIKKKYDHINLSSIELEKTSKKILKQRGYNVFENFDDINEKFDLIISTQTIQQLSNFDIFTFFRSISHKNTFVFLDVPNNNFSEKFLRRPYDSPRLIFYSKKCFFKIEKKFNLDIKNLSYASYSIDQAYQYMLNSKKKYDKWTLDYKIDLKQKIKNIIKGFIPKFFLNFKDFLRQPKDRDKLIDDFLLQNHDSWSIKIIFKWKI